MLEKIEPHVDGMCIMAIVGVLADGNVIMLRSASLEQAPTLVGIVELFRHDLAARILNSALSDV